MKSFNRVKTLRFGLDPLD